MIYFTKFTQKLVNSEYSKKDIKLILVEGIWKFEYSKWIVILPKIHAKYSPLYKEAEFLKNERKLKKFMA